MTSEEGQAWRVVTIHALLSQVGVLDLVPEHPSDTK